MSHPEWVRGLKLCSSFVRIGCHMSHPEWVRGLKLQVCKDPNASYKSHPEWVRGLKPPPANSVANSIGRTPSGCVD